MKSSLLVLGLCWLVGIPSASRADTRGYDLSLDAAGRLGPPGLSISATGGYSQLLWGDPSPGSILYGFLRPAIVARGIFTLGTAFELYVAPVSFLQFSVKRAYVLRLTDLISIDCQAVECQGALNYSSAGVDVFGGAGGFFGVFKYERQFYDPESRTTKQIADGINVLSVSPTGDSVNKFNLAIGKELDERLSVGLLFQHAKADLTRSQVDVEQIFFRHPWGSWFLYYFGGRVQSDLYGEGVQVGGYAKWDIMPKSLGF